MATILIAEDAAVVRLILRRALEAEGHEVVEAEDGPTAFTAIEGDDFDLAILDQLMPGMKAMDVLIAWRDQGIGLPVMILSAVDDPDAVVAALDAGASDYMRKPF
ncbi:MAG: response regulator, partial [Acidimicrobiia bacterium]|nr:response regulator [Acidimicrobiia bacterium]